MALPDHPHVDTDSRQPRRAYEPRCFSGVVGRSLSDRGRNSSLGHCVLSWNSRALRLANVCTLRARSECGAGSGPTVACILDGLRPWNHGGCADSWAEIWDQPRSRVLLPRPEGMAFISLGSYRDPASAANPQILPLRRYRRTLNSLKS